MGDDPHDGVPGKKLPFACACACTAFPWPFAALSLPFVDLPLPFVDLSQIIGCAIFSIVIGLFGSLLVERKMLEQKVETQLGELREFLQQKRVPKKLAQQVRQYMRVLYR